MRFTNIKPEYAEHSLARGLEDGLITGEDARLIREFIAELRAMEGIGLSRANKLTFSLVLWRRFIGPYSKNSILDLQQGIEKLRNAQYRGRPYRQNTVHDYLSHLKRFYRWLIENHRSEISVDRINRIRVPARRRREVFPEDCKKAFQLGKRLGQAGKKAFEDR